MFSNFVRTFLGRFPPPPDAILLSVTRSRVSLDCRCRHLSAHDSAPIKTLRRLFRSDFRNTKLKRITWKEHSMKNDAKSHQKILARDWDCPTSGGGHANQSGRRCKRRLWQLCCFGRTRKRQPRDNYERSQAPRLNPALKPPNIATTMIKNLLRQNRPISWAAT